MPVDGKWVCREAEDRAGLLRRLIRSDEGSTLVELTLLLPVLFAILLMATELAMYMQRSILVVEGASVGARFGIGAGNGSNIAGMTQAAKSEAENVSGFSAAPSTFCTCSPGGAKVDCSSSCGTARASHYVQVTTSATIPGIFNITGLPASMRPSATSTMRVSWPGN